MEAHPHSPAHRRRIFLRRAALGTFAIATTLISAFGTLRLLLVNGLSLLEWPILFLFVVLVFPITVSFWTAVFGFVVQLSGGDELSLTRAEAEDGAIELGAARTAIVIPAYNEDVVRLFAGIFSTYQSVEHTGQLKHFDFFLLSDTRSPDAWIQEEMAFNDLRRTVGDPDRLFYRNRRENAERKAGNIADFCATWGDDYRYMVVFDADSLMTGASLVNLVRLMEKRPTIGILQTPPVAVNRQTLFGRLHQFSTRAYAPMFITGLNFWQAGESNYWGHNAIIRIRPFVEHCRLPTLPGKAPLGGSILSHDFVEAALMRRAGWEVYLVSELGGSYEEIPANLIGHAARDRRWCQGNLQHARLLGMRGLNWISRVHMTMGIMAYATSPLWILMLLLSTSAALHMQLAAHNYFQPEQSPFPVWKVSIAGKSVLLLLSVLSMLLLPKLLSLAGWLTKGRRMLAGFGGAWKMTLSVLGETLVSVLVAPVLAMMHSRFVIGTLLGHNVIWSVQDRGDAETTWGAAFRWHVGITLLGTIWSCLLWTADRSLFWWVLPVLAGWMLSIPISAWTSKVSAGQWARRHGLFLTPEEVRPPAILKFFHEAVAVASGQPWAKSGDGFGWVLNDPSVRSIHLSMLPPQSDSKDPLALNRLEGLRLKVRTLGNGSLSPEEKNELLRDACSIEELKHGDSRGCSAIGR